MHFGKLLEAQQVAEWAPQYVNYKVLKRILERKSKPGSGVATSLVRRPSSLPSTTLPLEMLTRAWETPESASEDSIETKSGMMDILPSEWSEGSTQVLTPLVTARSASFLTQVNQEFLKVERFYKQQEQKLSESVSQYVNAADRYLKPSSRNSSSFLLTDRSFSSRFGIPAANETRRQHHLRTLREAGKELTRSISLLKNFQLLNHTAFTKICKKHDKYYPLKISRSVMTLVEKGYFYTSSELQNLTSMVEKAYVNLFAPNDPKKGLREIRVVASHTSSWTLFTFGGLAGIVFMLLVDVIFLLSSETLFTYSNPSFSAPWPLFRAIGLIVIHLACWSALVFVFKKTRLNHGFILELNPRTQLRWQQLSVLCGVLTVVYLSVFLFFLLIIFKQLNGEWNGIDATYIPLILFISSIFLLLCPFNVLHRSTRIYFLQTVKNIALSPFTPVGFKDFFLADHFCSMTRVFLDLSYSFCFYTTADFLYNESNDCVSAQSDGQWIATILPYFWRFLQCLRRYYDTRDAFPHLANAGKYGTSILVTSLNILQSMKHSHSLFNAWCCFATISTLYSYIWDVTMDWGLGTLTHIDGRWKFTFLRGNSTLEPERHWLYYWASISNLFLRVSWVLSISPATFGITMQKENFLFMLGALEIIRRAQWSFFRLENEHLNNCEQFRATRFVPLPPEDDFVDDSSSAATISDSTALSTNEDGDAGGSASGHGDEETKADLEHPLTQNASDDEQEDSAKLLAEPTSARGRSDSESHAEIPHGGGGATVRDGSLGRSGFPRVGSSGGSGSGVGLPSTGYGTLAQRSSIGVSRSAPRSRVLDNFADPIPFHEDDPPVRQSGSVGAAITPRSLPRGDIVELTT